jgi:SAM-dependent methyltransferase
LPVDDASVDACLLLGPLYHLPEPSDRASALSEAVRVTRPGGLVCAAAISRSAWPSYALRDGRVFTADLRASIADAMATGLGDPVGELPLAVSHWPSDLAAELAAAGLADVSVVGIEGPGWTAFTPDVAGARAEALLDVALSVARLCDGHPEIAAASAHLLAFAHRP